MKQRSIVSLFFFAAVFVTACSDKGKVGSSGSLTLRVTSSDFSRESAENRPSRVSCNVSVNGASQAGNCFTPYSVRATFSVARLDNTAGGVTPVRLLGGGEASSGLAGTFRKEALDLKAVPNIDSDDNVQDATAGSSYNLISFWLSSLDTVFVGTASGKYYHVRTFFVEQPPSVSGGVFGSCGLSTSLLSEIDTKGLLFTGMTARKGDILVCVKNTADETCAATDYRWVDSSGNLQASRPGSPKQLTGTYLATADTCSNPTAERPDLDWGYHKLSFGISPLSIDAEFAEGVKTYTHTVGGETQKGTKLTVTVDADLESSLFIHNSASISDIAGSTTETQLLQNIDKIMLKSVYVENTKTAATTADSNALSALLSLSLE